MKWLQKLPKPRIINREKFILSYCTGKAVLHLGFVDSGLLDQRLTRDEWLHSKLQSVCKELWGADIDLVGINYVKKNGFADNIVYGNVEDKDSINISKEFDVVVAGEIIEHLMDFNGFLKTLKQFQNDNGRIIITTPNSARYYNSLIALLGRELVHPDHTVWFSLSTLKQMLSRGDFEIEEVYVYQNINKFKPSKADGLGKIILKSPLFLFDFLFSNTFIRVFPYLSDGLVLVIK